MAKIAWNIFTNTYKSPIGFAAVVSGSLPKAMAFDRNKKKLPTPYGLFLEWAEKTLTGSWSSTKVTGGFFICVDNQTDANVIAKKFGTIGVSKKTQACDNTTQIGYQDSKYVALAKSLGYSL